MYYIYRFLNIKEEIIYIGKAKDLSNRLRGHKHLPEECYSNIQKIDFIELNNPVDMDLLEIYFINLWHPIYNTQQNYIGYSSNLSNLKTNYNWTSVDIEVVYKLKQKTKKQNLQKTQETKNLPSRRFTTEAKDTNLGRPRAEKPDNWEEVIGRWKSKEITAVKAMELLNMKKSTFYKYVEKEI